MTRRTFIKKLMGLGYSHKRSRSICYWHIKNRRAIESNKTQYIVNIPGEGWLCESGAERPF